MEKDLIEYIVKSLVDDPSVVSVRVDEKDASFILELSVGQEDIGKVIGKHGRVIKAIRVLLQAVAAKAGKRAVLEILD
ncbi:MAG: KH domain-containing protein [Spirochaetaceae bacterium]|nr:KH domain-containing protein [Spirochaetaceae bacterium]